MRKKKILAISLIVFSTITNIVAQGFTVNTDIVSSYIWRGINQGSNQPNIQPAVSYASGKFSIGATGSGNFSGSLKELDLYATYTISPLFALTLNDYDWIFTANKSYFNYKNNETDHILEGSVSYAGIESFPLTASINTAFYGADKKADGNQAYSTYVELTYPVAVNAKIFVGASLFDSPNVYNNSQFSIINVGLKISKSISITDKFSLPVYGIIGSNPNTKNAFFVVGITL
jgi:hypothetical protein